MNDGIPAPLAHLGELPVVTCCVGNCGRIHAFPSGRVRPADWPELRASLRARGLRLVVADVAGLPAVGVLCDPCGARLGTRRPMIGSLERAS